jgi:Ala-tRNA(Pro) deacylase
MRHEVQRAARELSPPAAGGLDVQQHRTAFTAQEIAETEHIPGKRVAKTVVAWADGELILLVLPASLQVDLARLTAALGGKGIRLAHESEFVDTFPDCEVGAMPPFGNLYNLPVYMDRSLTNNEVVVFPAGTHTESMSVRLADYARLVEPAIVEFARSKITFVP